MSTQSELIVVNIKNPINIAGAPITQITFREPELGDLIDAEENYSSELARTAFVLSRMCGADYADFIKLRAADIDTITEKCAKMLGNA